jgi:hypothetical protein
MWECHLQGLFRGVKLERVDSPTVKTVVYYFLGNPHKSGVYCDNAGKFYTQTLDTLSDQWEKQGKAPTGEVDLKQGVTANYRGDTLWDGS